MKAMSFRALLQRLEQVQRPTGAATAAKLGAGAVIVTAAAVVALSGSQAATIQSSNGGVQQLDFAGADIPFDAVRNEARGPLRVGTSKELEQRLASGGVLEISDSPLVIGAQGKGHRAKAYLAVDKLVLKNSASIVTNGADLVIVANKIESHDGAIRAFATSNMLAASGKMAGESGERGASGGTVTLMTVHGIEGRLHVDLSAQSGGDGAPNSEGTVGSTGSKGEKAQSGGLWCNHGGGNGLQGGKGNKGLTGGAGGPGGDGGSLFVYRLDSKEIASATIDGYLVRHGEPGKPGAGGNGGAGGAGGQGGDGVGPCSGGSPGPQGPTGDPGETGAKGTPGQDGTGTIKTVPLEVVLRETSIFKPE